MSDLQIISASLQSLTTAVSSAATAVMTTVNKGVVAYQERTQEMAKRTELLDKLTIGGQSIPLHVIVQPAPTEATPAEGVADAAEEAAGKLDPEAPPAEPAQA